MESELAGLGFRFEPLKIAVGPPGSPRAASARGVTRAATGGGGGGGGGTDRPPPASSSQARSKSVGFNLKQRRPGCAYSSPEPAAAAGGAAAEQAQSRAAPPALAGPGSPRQPTTAPAPTSSSLAHLKLASLRRRTAAAAAAGSHSSALPAAPALAADAPLPQPECEPAPHAHAAELLHDMESLLAGCDSTALDTPQPDVPLPPHLELGRPVLAVPPLPTVEGAAAQALLEPGDGVAALEQGGSIAAFRPAGMAADSGAAGAGQQPASPAEVAQGGSPPGASSRPATTPPNAHQAPASLQDALHCLGLLAQQRADSQEAAGPGGASSSGAPAPLWVRLHAVQLVAAGKQAAGVAELAPVLRRLRQVQAHLAFHQANVRRGRSPRRSTSPAPPGPWLSGRSSAQHSKHRASRGGSPGLQPRPKVSAPTPEASELQVQLLGSLRQKLLLKLGLAALRQAAAAARLQRRLLAHVAALGEGDLCRLVLQSWHVVAVPSQEQEAAAASLLRELLHRRQRLQLEAWQQWAAHRARRRRQLECALRERRRRLLAAAVQHWRCYCQQQLVRRLQGALAARWAAAWGRRRVFAAWRQAARRSALLKEALLVGRPGSAVDRSRGGTGAPPSQQEALAATAAAFAPVKAFVAEAAQQLSQLRRGLRFSVQDEEVSAALQQAVRQPEQEPLPLGSVEALLAVLAPTAAVQQQAAGAAMLTAPVLQAPEPAGSQRLPPALELPAAGSAGQGLPAALPAAAPAPDPGSPPPAYNPAAYASPDRPTSRQRQRRGHTAARADGTRLAEPPAAVEAELLDCQEQVARLQRELEALEQESARLQQECAELEAADAAGSRAVGQCREACAAAAAAKEAAAAAMQAAVQQHASAAAECAQHERELRRRQLESQEAVAAAAGARAAAHAAAERQSLAEMAVQRWRKAVEAAAKELSATHRSQQAPAQVRLREARQQLERQQAEAAAAGEQLPELRAVAEQAARQAQRAQQAVLDAQQRLVAAAEQRAARQRTLDAAMGRHEAAAVAAVAMEQEADAGEQRQRMLAAQQHVAAGRLRQVALQVSRKQQEAAALQEQVAALQQRHREAVVAALAAEQRQQYHAQHRRGRLKRRLQVVAEEGGEQLPASPTASQQRRPPPLAAAEASAGFVACTLPVAAAAADRPAEPAGQLVLRVPQPSDWSCCSSEPGSPPAEPATLLPLTVEEAAARFHRHCLLHRALRLLQEEARATRAALLAAHDRWRCKRQAVVLRAWKTHAGQAADWLHEASSALRRHGLLRQWRAEAALRRWRRQAEDTADGFARWHLLATGMAVWRQRLQHERWRDGVHEAVVSLRLRNMLQGWRQWTRRRRQKAARQRSALAVYEGRLAAAAFQQWRWVQHSRALLRRVFGTAAELWREEVGVRLYERNHERLGAAWRAWQLAVLEAQAVRQQAILWNAAAAFREKQLQLAGLQAFRRAVACAQEERRLARLQGHMVAEWRLLAASSARHWAYEAARRHRQRHLLRLAVRAWRDATEATASQLARFWLRWQVQAALRRALRGWRCAAAAQHEARVLGGMAEVHRERRLLQGGMDAFAANAQAARSGGATSGGSDISDSAVLHRPAGATMLAARDEQQQQQQQQPAGRRIATVSVSLGSSRRPSRQQGQGVTTTISISTQRHEEQEQVPPARAAYSLGDGGSCVPAVAEAARGMLDAVSSWRAAAEHWRQRHQSYSQPPAAAAAVAAISPRMLATLAEVRAQQRQR